MIGGLLPLAGLLSAKIVIQYSLIRALIFFISMLYAVALGEELFVMPPVPRGLD